MGRQAAGRSSHPLTQTESNFQGAATASDAEPGKRGSGSAPGFIWPSIWSRSSTGVTSSVVGVTLLVCVVGGLVLAAYLRLRPAPQSAGSAGGAPREQPLLIHGTHSPDSGESPRRYGTVAAPTEEAPRRTVRVPTARAQRDYVVAYPVAVTSAAPRPRVTVRSTRGVGAPGTADTAVDALEDEAARAVREADEAADALESRAVREREVADAAAEELERRAEQAREAAEEGFAEGRLTEAARDEAREAETAARAQAEQLRERAQDAEAEARTRAEQMRDQARAAEAQALLRARRLRAGER